MACDVEEESRLSGVGNYLDTSDCVASTVMNKGERSWFEKERDNSEDTWAHRAVVEIPAIFRSSLFFLFPFFLLEAENGGFD